MGPVLPLNWSQSLAMNLPPQGALLWKMFSRWVWQFGFLWRTYKQSPCAGGYGRRLTFRRLWGRIPAPYTGWKIFTYICVVKIVMFGKTKMNKKRLGMAHFLKKQFPFYKRGFRVLSKRKNVAKQQETNGANCFCSCQEMFYCFFLIFPLLFNISK